MVGGPGSFTRFPLLNTLRLGYRIVAGLTAVGSLFLLLCVLVVTGDMRPTILAALALVVVVPSAVISLLVVGEGIAVILAIEDHLFHLRSGGVNTEPAAQVGPSRSWRVQERRVGR